MVELKQCSIIQNFDLLKCTYNDNFRKTNGMSLKIIVYKLLLIFYTVYLFVYIVL